MKSFIRQPATALIILASLLLIFLLPFTGVVYQLISEIDYRINFAQKEIDGSTYLPPLWQLLQDLPEHSRISHNYLIGNIEREAILNSQSQVDEDFKQLEAVEEQIGKNLNTSSQFKAFNFNWQNIKQQSLSVKLGRSQDLYVQILEAQLLDELRHFIAYVGNTSKLILDPDLDSYYLMDAVLLKLPDTQEKIAQVIALTERMRSQQQIAPEEKAQLLNLAGIIAADKEALNQGLEVTFNHNLAQNIRPNLAEALHRVVAKTENLLLYLNEQLINPNLQINYQEARLFATKALEANLSLWDLTLDELNNLLQARIDKLSNKKHIIETFAIVIVGIAIYIFVAFTLNLIQRQQTEEALREAEEKYRSIVENSLDGIFQTTTDGRYISANSALARIYGYSSPEELIGNLTTIEQQLYVNPNRRAEFISLMQENDAVSDFESEIYRYDGSIIWISEHARAVRDANENLLFYEGTVIDITDRKHSEEALRQSEERFRSLISNIPGAVYRYKIGADETIEFISDVIEEISGYSANKLMTQKLSCIKNLIHAEDRSLVEQAIQEGVEKKQPHIVEYRIHRACDGSIRWVYDKGQASFNENDNALWIEGAIFDITDQKEKEALRQSEARFRKQTQQLKKALKELQETQAKLIHTEKMSSLGQMVAGVAHEINNPVNFIHGNIGHAKNAIQDLLHLIQLYQEHYSEPVSEIKAEIEAIDLEFISQDLPRMLQSMTSGTNRIREIVLSLRNFSRLDEAEMKLVDIHEGIDSALLILQNKLRAKSKNLAIEVIKEYSDLPQVECYAGQLNQVFMNILVNAIDALESQNSTRTIEEIKKNPSKITLHTALLESDRVAVRITDNGIGMDEATLKRIFDPFFTTKAVGQGTGLGLSISYQIVVNQHGGTIKCDSLPGKGTEFVIEIPISQTKVVNKPKEVVAI